MVALVNGSPVGVVVTEPVSTRWLVRVPPGWLPGLFAFDPQERVFAHLDQQRFLFMQQGQLVEIDERWRRLSA